MKLLYKISGQSEREKGNIHVT